MLDTFSYVCVPRHMWYPPIPTATEAPIAIPMIAPVERPSSDEAELVSTVVVVLVVTEEKTPIQSELYGAKTTLFPIVVAPVNCWPVLLGVIAMHSNPPSSG